jgi:pimeloyl-ACP methyl ester carboxylesterase
MNKAKLTESRVVFAVIGLVLTLTLSTACTQAPFKTAITTPQEIPSSSPPPLPTTTVVSITKDIVYATSLGEDGATRAKWELDVYSSQEAGEWPTAVLIHGYGPNKEGYIRASETMAASGAIVYTVNWPAMVVDMAARDNGRGYREISETLNCAIHFARATAAEYGGNPGRVTLIAHSWGTLYGAWFALASESLDAKWEEYAANGDGPPTQVECEMVSDSARVDAFIGIGGGRYQSAEKLQDRNPELWEIVSPFSHLGENLDLAIALLHGNRDNLASSESSQEFNRVLLQAGYDSRVILFDGGHVVPAEITSEALMELASK